MGQPHNRAGDEKNVTQRAKEQRKNQATNQYQHLYRGYFRFLGKKSKAALKKVRKRAHQRQQVLEQTGTSRGIPGPRPIADHLRMLSELTPEDQPQHEPNSERCENRLCWIFTHVLLCVLLERPDAIPGIAQGLLCLAPVLLRESACGGFQIFRCSARVFLAAL